MLTQVHLLGILQAGIMQALYVCLPTHLNLNLGLKDIIMSIRWSLFSDSSLTDQITYQFHELNTVEPYLLYNIH